MDLSKLDEYKEGNRLEVKAAQGGIPDSIWETVSAFANTSGGVIVLGVKDRKGHPLEVTGLPDAHKMLDDFWNAALSKDKLSARFLQDDDARIEDVGGKEVIVIEVPRVSRLMRPVFLKKDILGETWRRTHTGDHRCAREEVQSMLRDAESLSEDSRIAENVKMDHIGSETVRRYRVRFSEKNANHIWNAVSDEEFLEFIGAAKKDK
ncbi:MAG: ATP-binding protein, partial [Gordonibacter sp.]|uniref:AlbA family DNA-binding domain-containing protein n=1 Tax=Gordonibacter sp. TaxID=1968902 RepID=UPI002FC7DAAF